VGSVNWVKAVNGLGRKGVLFHISSEASGKVIVTRDRDLGGVNDIKSVVLELAGHTITATAKTGTGDGKQLFQADPNLNDEGECLLLVNGLSLRLWQVSRHALEDLFFKF
jgi:hypothetical protein